MLLNEFLAFKIRAIFDDEYNFLVVKEVLDNKDEYPLIYLDIADFVDYDDNDVVIEKEYDFPTFECDDPESCAGVSETLELNKAFVRAFFKNVKDKDFNIAKATFSAGYLRYNSIGSLINPYFNYSGCKSIVIRRDKVDVVNTVFIPRFYKGQFLGHLGEEEQVVSYYRTNNIKLNEVKEELLRLSKENELFNVKFNNELLGSNCTEIKEGIKGFPCDAFEFVISNNYIRFYATERGKDIYSNLRKIFFDALLFNQKDLDVVKEMKNIKYEEKK